MNIVFYDSASPAEYSASSLGQTGNKIGGTEATVIRIAVALSQHHQVTVAQRARRQSIRGATGPAWESMRDARSAIAAADVVVLLRKIEAVFAVRRINRRARLVVWYHEWYFGTRTLPTLFGRLQNRLRADIRCALHRMFRITAFAVSNTHAANVRTHLAEGLVTRPLSSGIGIEVVYNPIVVPATDAVGSTYDPTKLIYFSAPWKGLTQVLDSFARLSRALPEMTLYIASPGYQIATTAAGDSRIVNLGNLAHADLFRHVGSSLCVFYPANRVPETFGLVFAESHAVGTPVLAHPFGAATELLTGEELVDAADIDAVIARVRAWRMSGRPVVSVNRELELPRVVSRWETLLASARSDARDETLLRPGPDSITHDR